MPIHARNIIPPARFAHLHVLVLVLILGFSTACERERIVDPGPDTTAPLPPVDLLVEGARDGYIFISWIRNRELDLRGYVIYRSEEGDAPRFVAVDTIGENYFFDEQRSYDSTYFYFVTAVDEDGNESPPSDTVSARARNVREPEAPRNLQVNGFNDGSRRLWLLSWSPVEEADLSLYRIYRSDIPIDRADPALLLAESDASFFDDVSAAAPGWRWFYAVTAVDRGGLESPLSSVQSDIIAIRPTLLSPAHNTQAPSYPMLRWHRVSAASGYLLTVSLSERSGEIWSRGVAQGSGDTLSFRYDGRALSVGQTYYWRVSSVTATNGKPNGVSDAWRFQVRD
ncbi:MAG: hypothetical protein KFF77_05835 [Bacteroidetes bacterium]|nr:hypothetical protein [Bacteroidota bacterium]